MKTFLSNEITISEKEKQVRAFVQEGQKNPEAWAEWIRSNEVERHLRALPVGALIIYLRIFNRGTVGTLLCIMVLYWKRMMTIWLSSTTLAKMNGWIF